MFCFPISDHVMPSWEFSFCFFIGYAYICSCIRRHLKETIPSSSITWSEMGKQNIQAKEVYCFFLLLYIVDKLRFRGTGRGAVELIIENERFTVVR